MTDRARAYACLIACVLAWIAIGSMWRVILRRMTTSKLHVALAAAIGSLLVYIPDSIKLIPGLPAVAGNALCAVVLAVAYALFPKQESKPADKSGQAGYVNASALALLCGLIVAAPLACAVLGKAKDDPAKTADDARKAALTACLACRLPDLPAEAVKACAALEPVCSALADAP